MKTTFKYLVLSLILSAFIACGEDDDTSPADVDDTPVTLVGYWNAFEIEGDDGATYGLNQFVPYHDSLAVPGCAVFDYQEKYLEYSFDFKANGTAMFVYRSSDQDRSYTVNNAATCNFTYGAWNTVNNADTIDFEYQKLSDTQLNVKFDSTNPFEIMNYSLIGGVLILDDEVDIRLKK